MSTAPRLARLKVRQLPEPGDAYETSPGGPLMSTAALLTHDERKASEAAFHPSTQKSEASSSVVEPILTRHQVSTNQTAPWTGQTSPIMWPWVVVLAVFLLALAVVVIAIRWR